jgi:HSP20 family molecular chaperone IbpA
MNLETDVFREVKCMVLRRWEPFRELRQMQENMDRLWRSFGHGEGEAGNVENWAIPLDVVQQGDNIAVKTSVLGANPEDLDVSISDGSRQPRTLRIWTGKSRCIFLKRVLFLAVRNSGS